MWTIRDMRSPMKCELIIDNHNIVVKSILKTNEQLGVSLTSLSIKKKQHIHKNILKYKHNLTIRKNLNLYINLNHSKIYL